MIATQLGDYAVEFHRTHGTLAALRVGDHDYPRATPTPHYTMSPLAMWAQPALLGNASGRDLAELSTTPQEAARAVWALLDQPHPATSLSMMLWLNTSVSATAVDDICRALAERGHWAGRGLPDAADLAYWATQSTWGFTEHFPVSTDNPNAELVEFLHGTGPVPPAMVGGVAVASAGTWSAPLTRVRSGSLAPAWAVDWVLKVTGPDCGLAWDPHLGLLGVTVNRCGNGLFTVSVIGDRTHPDDEVMSAAVRITQRFSSGEKVFLTIAELRPGVGDWWRVGDDPAFDHPMVEQSYNSALLPAWSAGCHADIMEYGLGYWDTFHVGLLEQIGAPYEQVNAAQSAGITFSADGIAAYAVNGTSIEHAGLLTALCATYLPEPKPPRPQPVATGATIVELDYRHPFAVVVASASEGRGHVWQGAPLHIAWVTQAQEP